jgi:hypothetical protein
MSRISKTGLLILSGFSIPILVELRTLLSFVNIEISAEAAMAIGAIYLAVLILYGTFPEADESNTGS